jgi:hypothetical protein
MGWHNFNLVLMQRIGDTEDTQATASGVNFDQVVYNMLLEDGILPAVAIPFGIAQCRLESNNYTSNVFKTNNNLNGYKYVAGAEFQDGPGLMSPEGDNYANYDSVENSAHELSGWWARRAAAGLDLSTLTSIDAYAQALANAGWYKSAEPAYALRMKAVDSLVNFQNSTGINTQGVSLDLAGVGVAAAIVGLIYILA